MKTAYQSTLPLLTPATASVQGAPLLKSARKKPGFIPNMYATMMHSTGHLETCQLGSQHFREGSGFNPVEQEVIFLTTPTAK